MSTLVRTARLLRSHPGLLVRTALGKAAARLGLPGTARIGRVGAIRYEFPVHLDPMVRLMYWGAYEAFTIAALRRLLRPGDTFVDVGANIGYLSAVGASRVGPTGQVHAFEPLPHYVAWVTRLRELNPGSAIHVNACAVGEREGTATVDCAAIPNLGWNTMVTGFMRPEIRGASVEVPVIRLADYLGARAATLGHVGCVKIDVEGFELPVLLGLEPWLAARPDRPPILCEVAPAAYAHLGRTTADLAAWCARWGYRATDLEAWGRPVDVTTLPDTTMVVFEADAAR